MGVSNDGWVSWATRIDGVPDKVWRPNRAKRYLVNHSIEGWLGGAPVPARFLSLERAPGGGYSAAAQASVHFVLHWDGELIQMYPLNASPWTSGSQAANENGVAIESEGVAGTPLSPAQRTTYVRLVRELEPWFGFELRRETRTIQEHRELSSTACPSGRYDAVYPLLAETPQPQTEEAEMTKDEVLALIREEIGVMVADGAVVSGTAFLPLLAQAVGAEKSTFTDNSGHPDPRVASIRKVLTLAAIPEHGHLSGPVAR